MMHQYVFNKADRLTVSIKRLEKKQDQIRYADVILDFSYFKISEAQDKKIEENAVSTAPVHLTILQIHNYSLYVFLFK